jgi:sec-independent protein translocase protein TatC
MTSEANKQPILEHISELRRRLTWALVALLVGTVISFIFAERLLAFLITPYGARVQAISPTDTISTYFKVALVSGAILTMPIILLQIWLFISPGLEPRERRLVYVFVPAAFGLFLTGIVFSWLVLLPTAIRFLADFMPEIFTVEWTAPEYIGFTTRLLFWIGVSFEMPLIIYLLARVGIVTAGCVARAMAHCRRRHRHPGSGHHADYRSSDDAADDGAASRPLLPEHRSRRRRRAAIPAQHVGRLSREAGCMPH